MSVTRLTTLYGLFALLATLANIAAQDISVRLYQGNFSLIFSIALGTLVGLVVKYVLDKRFIFAFRAESLGHDGRVFLLYSAMGVLTTLIFWGFEGLFHWLFASKEMRYLGAVIGLTIGYISKYQLDKRFVFSSQGVA